MARSRCSAALTAINAAVEGLGRALAHELAPVRVNVICPGLVDTEMWERLPSAQRQEITSPYMTGTVVDIDGGALLG